MAKNKELNEEIALSMRVRRAFMSYRELRGFGQKQMADYLEVGEDTYHLWETFEKNPKRYVSLYTLKLFCDKTGYDINGVMAGQLVMPEAPPQRRKKAKRPAAAERKAI